ncbi:MAG: hypothetical protein ACD_26C00072G0001 [uncultured bacterium]|nr:MAG: hypothetical protein ACD_26C00072G0001 [uncultured bacterium]
MGDVEGIIEEKLIFFGISVDTTCFDIEFFIFSNSILICDAIKKTTTNTVKKALMMTNIFTRILSDLGK